MTNRDHEHPRDVILKLTEDAVVSNPIAPITAEFGATQGSSQLARVIKRSNAITQEVADAGRLG